MSGAEPPAVAVSVIASDDALRHSLELMLRSRGLAVECFADVADFGAHRRSGRRDCVLLSLESRTRDKLADLRTLMSLALDLAVVVLASQISGIERASCLELGAAELLLNPCEPELLVGAIRQALIDIATDAS